MQERPDLSEMKASLMVNNARMKTELSLLEDTILQMLSASQGNILDDENLINTLAVSKVRLRLHTAAVGVLLFISHPHQHTGLHEDNTHILHSNSTFTL